MRRLAVLLVVGAMHGGLLVALTAALESRVGLGVALVAGCVALLATRRARGRLERRIMAWVGDPRQRRMANADGVKEELKTATSAEDAVEVIADVLGRSIDAAFVAVDLFVEGEELRMAHSGAADHGPEAQLPILGGASEIGRVLLAPGPGGAMLRGRELAFAAEVVRRAGPALHAARLRLAVEAERARRAAERDAELLRLSHDLHDRVGPTLAAMKMTLAARRRARLPIGPPLEGTQLAGQAAEAAVEIDRVLQQLGPVGVGDHGLVDAVERMAARLAADEGPIVVVRSPVELGGLQPEVAHTAFAVAAEAISNAVRHASARTCTIRFELDEALRLVIEDDGVGLSAQPRAGLGLDSMRQRTRDLGGNLRIEPLARGGTRVVATLPRADRSPRG